MAVTLVIRGEPVSSKNSREIVRARDGRAFLVKSKKAQRYERDVKAQVARLPELLAGELRFTATLYYASNRPDLDAELLIDCLQGRLYANDRAIVEKHLTKKIDKANPRAEVTVEQIEQLALEGAAA